MKVVHWTGWKTDKRAQEAGKNYELFYHEQYALLSLYTHAGLIGIQGMKKDGLEAVFEMHICLPRQCFQMRLCWSQKN